MPDEADRDSQPHGAPVTVPQPPGRPAASWRQLGVVVVAIIGTVIVADRALAVLAPPTAQREVWDAVADMTNGDPEILALGSSHARTFDAVGDELERRTDGDVSLVAVPLEFGRVTGYRWVFEERLLPLMDERDHAGRLVRPSLSRFIIVTDWWDSCHWDAPLYNLPARAWLLHHFVNDARQHGLTPFNRNYLSSKWERLGVRSALISERGQYRVLGLIRAQVAPPSRAVVEQRFERMATEWRAMIEDGDDCLADEREMSALRAMIAALHARDIEPTILLYPRMPATVSDRGRATTLARFSRIAHALAEETGARIVDLTSNTPLTDADFAWDFDHVLPEGNRRFAQWAVDGPLSYLLDRRERTADLMR